MTNAEGTRRCTSICAACGGSLSGIVDLAAAKWSATIPWRCKDRTGCEAKVLAALGITPVKDAAGAIVRD